MGNLVNLTGSFPLDEIKEILRDVEVLLNQPPFEFHKAYTDKNPRFSYRHVFVSRVNINELQYHAMDIGRVNGEAGTTSIGDRIYSEADVKKLR